MSLYKDWVEMASSANTQQEAEAFWKDYSSAEKRIYEDILSRPYEAVEGVVKDFAEKYQTSKELFMGFLDGINESIVTPLNLEDINEDSSIKLEIDLEKLYFNMLAAKADYLYTLSQWNQILSEEKRAEIEKSYKSSKTVIKGEKIGRNDPCPCGSGKKYKKCCGK